MVGDDGLEPPMDEPCNTTIKQCQFERACLLKSLSKLCYNNNARFR